MLCGAFPFYPKFLNECLFDLFSKLEKKVYFRLSLHINFNIEYWGQILSTFRLVFAGCIQLTERFWTGVKFGNSDGTAMDRSNTYFFGPRWTMLLASILTLPSYKKWKCLSIKQLCYTKFIAYLSLAWSGVHIALAFMKSRESVYWVVPGHLFFFTGVIWMAQCPEDKYDKILILTANDAWLRKDHPMSKFHGFNMVQPCMRGPSGRA